MTAASSTMLVLHLTLGLTAFGLARWLYLRARAVRSRALRFAVAGFVLFGAGGLAMAAAEAAFQAGLDAGMAGRLYKAAWQVSCVWFAYFMARFAFRYFHLLIPYKVLLYGTLVAIAFSAAFELAGWRLIEAEGGIPEIETTALGEGLLMAMAGAWLVIFSVLTVSFFVSSHREAIPRRRVAKAYTGAALALVPLTAVWVPLAAHDGNAHFYLLMQAHVLLWQVLVAVGLWWVFVGPSAAGQGARPRPRVRASTRPPGGDARAS